MAADCVEGASVRLDTVSVHIFAFLLVFVNLRVFLTTPTALNAEKSPPGIRADAELNTDTRSYRDIRDYTNPIKTKNQYQSSESLPIPDTDPILISLRDWKPVLGMFWSQVQGYLCAELRALLK